MLSESYMLLKTLKDNKINLPDYHPRVKSPGQSFAPTIKVSLDNKGIVKAVEELTEEEMFSLWTIREGNQNSFPIIRLPIPFRVLKEKDKSLLKRLRQIKAKELRTLPNLPEKLNQFAESFSSACENIDVLLHSISNKITEASKNNRFNKDLADKIIKGPRESQIQLAFDLANKSIYYKEIRNSLEDALPFEIIEKKRKFDNISSECAFSCKQDVLRAPFPKVKFPILNREFPVFSMFKEAKCNYRYGLIDHEIIPLSRSESVNIAKALLWITDSTRFEKTWRGIARGEYEKRGRRKIYKRDLLLVYVDGKPDISVNVANIFGTDQDSIVKQFETDAKTVCDTLDGVAKITPKSKLNLFVLRDVSQGQVQVVISNSFSVSNFIESAKRWQQTIKNNLPEIDLILPPDQKSGKAIIAEPPVLYPEEIVKILSKKYIRQGLDVREVKGIAFSEVLDFMFRKEGKWNEVSKKMLILTIYNYAPLLVGVFGAKNSCDNGKFQKYLPQFRKDALRAVSLLGLILDANNRKKEVYMKDAAFKIGGFLALADILHKDYCIVVRKGSLPPSLIGNAMMPHTFDNPRLAIGDIADRMRVYTGWAKTAKVTDDNEERKFAVLEAKKTLIRYEPLAEQLHKLGLPDQCDEKMKAEILLGYLASTKGIDIGTNKTEQEVKS